MAAKATTIFLLPSLCTMKTLAKLINPATVPACRGQFKDISLSDCREGYEAAYGGASATEFMDTLSAQRYALIKVNDMRTNSRSSLSSMKRDSQFQAFFTCSKTFSLAIYYLDKAYTVLDGNLALTNSQVIGVQRCVQLAAQNVQKCTDGLKLGDGFTTLARCGVTSEK